MYRLRLLPEKSEVENRDEMVQKWFFATSEPNDSGRGLSN